jgi:hypothetical protein
MQQEYQDLSLCALAIALFDNNIVVLDRDRIWENFSLVLFCRISEINTLSISGWVSLDCVFISFYLFDL